MSCWHFTVLLRIPASALGFKYLREWKEFLEKHEDDFNWEEDCFCESLSEDFPLQDGYIAIPGSSNPDHIAENYDIFDFELSEDEMDRIRGIDEQRRKEQHYEIYKAGRFQSECIPDLHGMYGIWRLRTRPAQLDHR